MTRTPVYLPCSQTSVISRVDYMPVLSSRLSGSQGVLVDLIPRYISHRDPETVESVTLSVEGSQERNELGFLAVDVLSL